MEFRIWNLKIRIVPYHIGSKLGYGMVLRPKREPIPRRDQIPTQMMILLLHE